MHKELSFPAVLILLFIRCSGDYEQPVIEARKAEIIKEGRYRFKDLNKNGVLDPYEDWRLGTEDRIANLVSLMTLEEKAALMFHPNFAVPPDGTIKYDLTDEERQALALTASEPYGVPTGPGSHTGGQGGGTVIIGQTRASATAKSYIEEKNFRCLLNNGVAEPKLFAEWSNGLQELAEASRLGIPVLFSTDPRHGVNLGGHVTGAQYFSQWPGIEGMIGMGASRDTALMRKYGEVVAEEYRAVGLHMILGPQIDLPTDPRWRRSSGSISESAELTADMLGAFMDGAQGPSVGPSKILVQLKHWPGSGTHKGGEGDWLVYPGDNFEYHLIPWKAGIAKGALAVMGYYSGTYHDTLGVNFSKYISTEVLYNQLGFRGSICTDWFVITRKGALRPDLVGMPVIDRFELSINAGVDQFGAETMPEMIVELVRSGRISEARIDLAASRILQWHFKLGLFEDPYVDPEAAQRILKSDKNKQLGYRAMLESIVLLSNDGILPYRAGKEPSKIYVFGMDTLIAAQYGMVAGRPGQADLAIVKVDCVPVAAAEGAEDTGIDISFPRPALDTLRLIASAGVPVVAVLNISRSLTVLPRELFSLCRAALMTFGVLDNAVLDVIYGKFNPVGKMPFELPSSMEAVRNQLEDVPFDSENPLFGFGYGLSYN